MISRRQMKQSYQSIYLSRFKQRRLSNKQLTNYLAFFLTLVLLVIAINSVINDKVKSMQKVDIPASTNIVADTPYTDTTYASPSPTPISALVPAVSLSEDITPT